MQRWFTVQSTGLFFAVVGAIAPLVCWHAKGLAYPAQSFPSITIAQADFTLETGDRFRIYDAWRLVYVALPEFPLENQYVDVESGDIAEENTLANRLIRYHLFVKGRPVQNRFDWKLTLADYLGANEPILAFNYPGNDTLESNPLTGDQAAISQMNRAERDRLVEVLVTIFTNGSLTPAEAPSEDPQPSVPAPVIPAPAPILTEPGSADQLLF